MSIPYTATTLAIKGYSESLLAKSETRDCVVRAIASAYDIHYGMNRMSDNNTRFNYKKTKTIDSKFLTTNGGKSKMSVGTFVKEYDKGTYIIRVSGHAFTIKDGSVIGNPNDATQLRKVVKNAWKIGS
jgi:hypothetical protein